jgi:2-oxoglutarate dehydrogenase E2 component (dihydrolipoamide succinyltransferase)
MTTEIKVPVLPESVSDAVIASWHKKVGDAVKRDENIVDLETDKVVLEVPSTVDGVIKELKFAEGATVTSQQVIAIIEEGAVAAAAPAPASLGAAPAATAEAAHPPAAAPVAARAAPTTASSGAELPPGARFAAATAGVNPAEVQGTGRRGAVTKEDIVNYASGKTAGVGGGARPEERVPMTRMRTRIAERLMQSKNSIAMLTSFNEVNLGKVMAMRKELGEQFEKANGIKLGFMSFFAKAAANALQRHPVVNASVDGNDIIYHGYADISIAVSTDKGLVTPVLRNVERMGFADIENAIAGYAKAAREGGLKLEDLQGGTFTITNGGTFGSLMSTPIVNPPQSAILGMHAIKERPIAENGQVVIAPMMYIALSYDHRIIDGKDAVLFLVDIKNQLENPHRMLLGM